MHPRTWMMAACATIALGFVLIALPLGVNPFSVTCYATAAALLACAIVQVFPSARRVGTSAGFLVAAIASLNLVRLLIGATLDLIVFLLIATGLFGAIAATIWPNPWTRSLILTGAAGAATYLVHDFAVGYTNQLAADAVLLLGFVMLWRAHTPREATP